MKAGEDMSSSYPTSITRPGNRRAISWYEMNCLAYETSAYFSRYSSKDMSARSRPSW